MEVGLVFKGNDGQALTNSLLVSKKFEKKHSHVLDAIRKIITTAENSAVLKMFAGSQYVNEQNKEQPMYVMNRDGFTLLAMGFTGKQAMQFKIDYIGEFNRMEKEIKEGANLINKPTTPAQMFALQAQINLDNENRLNALEKKVESMEAEREENGRLLLEAQVSSNTVPAMSLRKSIIALVNEYSSATNISQKDVWHAVYKDLYYKYDKSINSYTKLFSRESKLDIAERKGLLQPIFDIISDMIVKWRESQQK